MRRYGAYDIFRVVVRIQLLEIFKLTYPVNIQSLRSLLRTQVVSCTTPNEILKLTYPVYIQSLCPLLRTQVVSYLCDYTPDIRSMYAIDISSFQSSYLPLFDGMCFCIFVVLAHLS